MKSVVWRKIKILLPHILLTCILAGYLFAGAAIFQSLENEHDLELLKNKAQKVINIYQAVEQEVITMCHLDAHEEWSTIWRKNLYHQLSLVSEMHEGRSYKIDPDDPKKLEKLIKPRWTLTDAFLYSLSILTTTGYTFATPVTKTGQIVAVAYGLIGIPLMVFMAVDIGRFLSDIVISKQTESVKETNNNVEIKEETLTKHKQESKLPLWANFSLLILFNTLGAVIYMFHNETNASFLESFFVCFNLLANLTMAEVPIINDTFMILYIVIFVTFGLAVLSMCADLAASQLKWLFLKIHYFGRKITFKKSTLETVAELVQKEEVKTLLSIIDQVRSQDPSKSEITYEDVVEYLQNVSDSMNRNNVDPAYLKLRRRATSAFMPCGLDVLKFVDADDAENSGSRYLDSIAEINE